MKRFSFLRLSRLSTKLGIMSLLLRAVDCV